MLVRDAVGRLWGEAHRPTIVVNDDPGTSIWIQAFIRDTLAWLTMIEASWQGATGSVAVVLRVLGDSEEIVDEAAGTTTKKARGKGRFYAAVWPTKECKPVFLAHRPDQLKSIERIQYLKPDVLATDGYDIAALERRWDKGNRKNPTKVSLWILRTTIDANMETVYDPVPASEYAKSEWVDANFTIDADRTTEHDLGETPALWCRPMPIRSANFPEGLCLFEPVIDFQFRIDRTLSQVGRALDYAGDPQLAIDDSDADPSGEFGESDAMDASASSTIDGKAEYVEIDGRGLQVAIEHYVRILVRLGREVGGGSRIDEEKSLGSISGVAMRLLNAALDMLAGILRMTLGEQLFIDFIRLAMRMSLKVNVELPSLPAIKKKAEFSGDITPDPDALIDAQWPDAYAPQGQDLLFQIQAIEQAAAAEDGPPLISMDTAIAQAASLFGTQDAKAEKKQIVADIGLPQTTRAPE